MKNLYDIKTVKSVEISHDDFIVKYDGRELIITINDGLAYYDLIPPDIVETLGMAIIDAAKEFIN